MRSKRARRISITVRPYQGVRVTVPARGSMAEAKRFVAQKQAWIERAVAKVRAREQRVVYGPETPAPTRSHRLAFVQSNVDAPSVRVSAGTIRIQVPASLRIESEPVQSVIRDGIVRALRIEAKAYLPDRVAQLARRHGFSFKSVAIKNARTRWGSCSAQNRINLNLHLMRLPDELVDYVILHELVHTVHKHHQPAFWDALEAVCPGSKQLDRRLKEFELTSG
ncbi:MAG: SprT family zinc-dependent metalloprotease [Bacteroidota bacterium]